MILGHRVKTAGATAATGVRSFASGYLTTASGDYSVAEGRNTTADGDSSHAEGDSTSAPGHYSHAEGRLTTAGVAGASSHAHAEGLSTAATGLYSHAEGSGTTASGKFSHSEGDNTIASGEASHASGSVAVANSIYTFVWSDGAPFTNSAANQFNVHATTGSRFMHGPVSIESNLSVTNCIFIRTNDAAPPTATAGGGWLWNSNNVLYWVTTANTNFIAGP